MNMKALEHKGYPPSHPWYWYQFGPILDPLDAPLPEDDWISCDIEDIAAIEDPLHQRRQAERQIAQERSALETDVQRHRCQMRLYRVCVHRVKRGKPPVPLALVRYGRENGLDVCVNVALTWSHVYVTRRRIRHLERILERNAAPTLFSP